VKTNRRFDKSSYTCFTISVCNHVCSWHVLICAFLDAYSPWFRVNRGIPTSLHTELSSMEDPQAPGSTYLNFIRNKAPTILIAFVSALTKPNNPSPTLQELHPKSNSKHLSTELMLHSISWLPFNMQPR
jgi:hypothetical protein